MPSYRASQTKDLHYGTAGHFVRWLIETRGLESVQSMIRGSNPEIEFSATIEELAEEFETEAPFIYPDWSPCPYPDLTQVDEGLWVDDFDFDCASEDAERLAAGLSPSVSRAVDLEEGTYRVRMEDGLGVWLLGCQLETIQDFRSSHTADKELILWNGDVLNEAQLAQTARPFLFEAGEDHLLQLTEGRYQVMVSAGIDEESYQGSLTIERVE